MKKREEGYVLLYVVIVITLLSVLAMTICTISLRNLQGQQASLERTRQLYAAEGKIERFVANVQDSGVAQPPSEDPYSGFSNLVDALGSAPGLGLGNLPEWGSGGGVLIVTAVEGTVSVSAELLFRLTVTEVTEGETGETGEPEGQPSGEYQITAISVTYLSYTIDSVESTSE